MADPRDHVPALAATALVDALMLRLEARGVLRPGERDEIVAQAVGSLRGGGEPSRKAAGFLERAFRLVPAPDRRRAG